MPRTALLTAALLVLAGCTGMPIGDNSTLTPTATTTPNPPDDTARDRAIAAEKNRIHGAMAGRENVTGLSIGILRPAEAEVVARNATGAFVAVTVGYSYMVENCGSFDGATTKTRYFVTTERTRLVTIEQDVSDRRSC